MKDKINKGKLLAFLLRHDKEYAFDRNGWRDVDDLVKNHGYTIEELDEIVGTDDKQRYEFNNDKSKIRANQGHSIDVDVELTEAVPPDTLFHGTTLRFLDSISKKGILKMDRKYVHLSDDYDTAVKVGIRHGQPRVLLIDARRMVTDGHKFYRSRNGVWLTDFVDTKYLKPFSIL